MTQFINVADIVNPNTGKTYREENEALKHNIPLKSLVEIAIRDEYLDSPKNGLRLFVVSHDRDCDGTPLYSLSFDRDWEPNMYGELINPNVTRIRIDNGYSEECLKVISLPKEIKQ